MNKFFDSPIPIRKRNRNYRSFLVSIVNSIKKNTAAPAIKFAKYWGSPISIHVQTIRYNINVSQNKTKALIVSSLLSAISAIMQSVGALGGPGFAVSALVTLPIAIASIFAIYSGIMAYITTLFLLLIIQPSEIFIFPFTTGLLGLGIGLAFKLFKKRGIVIAFSSLFLTTGIAVLLYIIKFPVLGPSISSEFQISMLVIIYVFSFLYSCLWVEVIMVSYKILSKALTKNID